MKFILSIILALFLCLINACGPSAKTISGSKSPLPETFKDYSGGILIEKYKERGKSDFTTNSKIAFEKFYKGKFLIVEEVSGEYDKSEYRYAVMYSYVGSSKDRNGSASVFVYDRKTHQDYHITSLANLKNLESLAQGMEMLRGK